VQFARQFATLTESAVPLVLSLEILLGLTEDRPLRQAIATVTEDIQGGATLADSLRRHPKVFSGIFIAVVDAGEEGGTLDVTLNRLADYMERSQEIRDRISGAMVYPIVIASVAVASVVALLTLVVPTFEAMFAASGMALPFATQMLVNASRFLGANLWLFLAGLLAGSLIVKATLDSDGGRRSLHRLVLRLPVLGSLAKKVAVARFSRTIASLLASGVSILDALVAAAKTAGNSAIEDAMLRCRDGIASGKDISSSLTEESILPPLVSRMVGVGEQTGRLGDMFAKVADFYEREVDAQVEGLLKALEPILVVLVGVILGGMVIAMYLPIFDIVGAVG
jgi:type IV pilus assembly protein PilC